MKFLRFNWPKCTFFMSITSLPIKKEKINFFTLYYNFSNMDLLLLTYLEKFKFITFEWYCKAQLFLPLLFSGLPQSYGPKGWPNTNSDLMCPNPNHYAHFRKNRTLTPLSCCRHPLLGFGITIAKQAHSHSSTPHKSLPTQALCPFRCFLVLAARTYSSELVLNLSHCFSSLEAALWATVLHGSSVEALANTSQVREARDPCLKIDSCTFVVVSHDYMVVVLL